MVTRIGVTSGAPGSVAAAFTPTLPTHQLGDRLIVMVIGKYGAPAPATATTGWVKRQQNSNSGTVTTTGNDVGSISVSSFIKDAESSAEPAPSITPGSGQNSIVWFAFSYRPDAGKEWAETPITMSAFFGSKSTTTAPLTFSGNPNPAGTTNITAGDTLLAVGGIPTDLGTALGACSITTPGLSGGTVTAATTQYVENALGTDMAAGWLDWADFTGTHTPGAATSVSMTFTGASNQSGAGQVLALRQVDVAAPAAPAFSGWGFPI